MNYDVTYLLVGVTKVNFMWCVFHNAQWYWSDNLCKLVTDQWRASLGVRDSESCWFTKHELILVEETNRFLHTFLGKTGWSSTSDRNFMSFREWSAAKRHNNFYHERKITQAFPTTVNFMWCVFHNAQWYWSDILCKLVNDQWRASLGVCDSESCWFTEEIGTYMRC
jgi:hypothetical protein